jgi:hypothetical protein
MRLTAIRRLASVAVATLLLAGCAKHVIERPTQAALPPPSVQPPCATISTRPGRAGLIVAAPPGPSELRTDDIATEIARRTGFGLLLVTGGAAETPARRLCDADERRVRDVAQGPLRFYAEIQGTNRSESAGRIEIATAGVDREYALRLRALAELIRDAYLRGYAGAPRLDVLVEPVAAPREAAPGARLAGLALASERAMHIELPRAARGDFREVYTAILAEFLAEAVNLPVGR